MIDLYLKAADEAAMNKALISAGLLVKSENGLTPVAGVSLDMIGNIVNVTGYDADGAPVTQTVLGWHVNVRCEELSKQQQTALDKFVIPAPKTPYRVWA